MVRFWSVSVVESTSRMRSDQPLPPVIMVLVAPLPEMVSASVTSRSPTSEVLSEPLILKV